MAPKQQPRDQLPEQLSALEDTPPDSEVTSQRTPVVGIGTSAGGLETLQVFLQHTPATTGLAFVIVQHLDPTYKGTLVELLQHSTTMPIMQVNESAVIEPNKVYVIAPNTDLSILQGVLHALPPAAPRGLRLPIDTFFRALALDLGEHSIGVILSGMGSDGTLGLRAIKEKAGIALVQAPSSAKFDGMPRSAIDAGLADVVAPVEDLPGHIIAHREHVLQIGESAAARGDKRPSDLDRILVLLRAQTGHDFSQYKASTISRRIERRMTLHLLNSMPDYVRYLRENPKEIDLLFEELLIGVTSFFRDPEVWKRLKEEALLPLLASRASSGALRAWVAGCSTGEEAYSLGMLIQEAMQQAQPAKRLQVQIFATDLDQHAISRARMGSYPDNIVADVSEERLHRFFVQDESGFRVRGDLREKMIFAVHNLVMDPPFNHVDLVVCRNVLIYLNPDVQQRLIRIFHRGLNPGGYLLLGSSETAGASELFTPVNAKARLYQRSESSHATNPADIPIASPTLSAAAALQTASAKTERTAQGMQMLVEQTLLQSHCPAAVLVTESGDILYISGRTGKYLEPTAGKANWNVFAMAHEGLNHVLLRAFDQARRQKDTVVARSVRIQTDSGLQAVDVTVHPITRPGAPPGVLLVVFRDVEMPPAASPADISQKRTGIEAQIETELHRSREELRATREEMQASQEELRSINEEWQSNNEELQSTNEELTSSKEEMQSMNEELQTLNSELRAKVDELSRTNNDLRNLLDSTQIAVLFLDEDLHVRRFTSPMTEIISLISTDVGRPITDITSALIYPTMVSDVRHVLRTLTPRERTVATHSGHWYVVRIMPYRTLEHRIEGVVITFGDVSEAKRLELALREDEDRFRIAIARSGIAVASTDADLRYTWLQTAFPDLSPTRVLGKRDDELDHPLTNQAIQDLKQRVLETGRALEEQIHIETPDGGRVFRFAAEPRMDAEGRLTGIVTAGVDVTEQVRAMAAQRTSEERLAGLLEMIPEAVAFYDAQGRIALANAAAVRLLGLQWSSESGDQAIPTRWPLVREDGSTLEEGQHPALRALRSGQVVQEDILGVPGGPEDQLTWVRVRATPMFREGQITPHQVCAIYTTITPPQRPSQATAEGDGTHAR